MGTILHGRWAAASAAAVVLVMPWFAGQSRPSATPSGSSVGTSEVTAPGVFNPRFGDVPAGAYYATAADWLRARGITTGYGGDPTRFAPDVVVTRAQMATFLWRLHGSPPATPGGFADVPTGVYYETASGWLKSQGITTGYGGDPTRFAPDVAVTRAQMATFLWRLAGQPAAPPAGFADIPPGAFYAAAADRLAARAVTTGYGGDRTRFAPDVNLTRAQMAALLLRDTLGPESRLDAGGLHACALTTAGGVKCWGNNDHGQLGDGTTTDRSTPTPVMGLADGVIAVTAGGMHTCALTATGGVSCWGDNGNGQVGDGTTTDRPTPTTVTGLTTGMVAVTAGGSHTCAVAAVGVAGCWGRNDTGQIGDGTYNDHLSPVGVLSGAVVVAAGNIHTCAVTAAGATRCWGWNANGQLGDSTSTPRPYPGTVDGLATGSAHVTVGDQHTCAVTTAGSARCWGANSSGQLGDPTAPISFSPRPVSGLATGTEAISAGTAHTCAVTTAGAAACWGANSHGQLGDGTTTERSTPTAVTGLTSGAAAVSAGGEHTCAVTSTSAIRCWGGNAFGGLGDGSTTDRLTPVTVQGL